MAWHGMAPWHGMATRTTDADICRRLALYIGTSIDAIYCGRKVWYGRMETAAWKGRDDPSVVPGKETYRTRIGLGWALWVESCWGRIASFVPHMSEKLARFLGEGKERY